MGKKNHQWSQPEIANYIHFSIFSSRLLFSVQILFDIVAIKVQIQFYVLNFVSFYLHKYFPCGCKFFVKIYNRCMVFRYVCFPIIEYFI